MRMRCEIYAAAGFEELDKYRISYCVTCCFDATALIFIHSLKRMQFVQRKRKRAIENVISS